MRLHETPPVQLQIHLDVPRQHAYETFVTQFDRIKPREHNLLAVPIDETVLEAWPGGGIFDRGVDGSVCRWGEVLHVEPPSRLVLAWLIGPDYSLITDPADASEVEIRFVDLDGHSTRVELEHRHLDRHGRKAPSLRDDVGGDGGWPLYLQRLAEVSLEPSA